MMCILLYMQEEIIDLAKEKISNNRFGERGYNTISIRGKLFFTRIVLLAVMFSWGTGIEFLFAGANPPAPGSFTLVHLPDTQDYAQYHPNIQNAQNQWIIDNITTHNIKYVLHTGDLTNNNVVSEMDNALAAMSMLDGIIPYAISTGNHDYGSNGSNRNALFNNSSSNPLPYFGTGTPYATQVSIGGFFEPDQTDNSYHFFTAGGRDWMLLALEFGPREQVIPWANQILDNYPDHTVILMVHAYVYSDETR